ncbi:MAG: hypothetical protein NW216_14085 [Hyphomicrobium sp.]|nr:hypothetical protein [Hyphomicrobium sp.]
MIIITLIALLVVTLLPLSGLLSQGSVGSAMTIAAVHLAAAIVVGLYEAWSKGRGVLGWIVSVVVAFVGGLAGAWGGMMVIEQAIMFLKVEGSLAKSGHPLLYVMLNAQMLLTIAGASIVLWIVNRIR